MKLLKNKKGFTLIELLAVIVVLAIIMVIATTQINNTIKKSRANSFYDAAQMIERNTNMICASRTDGNGELTKEDIAELSDIEYSGSGSSATITDEDYDIEITLGSTSSDPSTIKIIAKTGGQFDGVNLKDYYHLNTCTTGGGTTCEGSRMKESFTGLESNSMTFKAECH